MHLMHPSLSLPDGEDEGSTRSVSTLAQDHEIIMEFIESSVKVADACTIYMYCTGNTVTYYYMPPLPSLQSIAEVE
jgi:hypothetical protein